MAKKIVDAKKEKSKMVDVSSLSLNELWVLFQIVNSDYNTVSGARNEVTKALISRRYNEVKNELYSRVYGENPFVVSKTVEVEGDSPENVIASFRDRVSDMVSKAKENQNFVVKKNEVSEEE